DDGPRAEHVEIVGGDHVAVDALGAVAAAEAHWRGAEAVRVDPCEHGVPRTDIEVVRIGTVVETLAVPRSADIDQAIRLDDTGRRLEQKSVRDREDRRVRADANGERQGRGQREERVAAQQARGVANVLHPGVEHEPYYAVRRERFTLRGLQYLPWSGG